MESAWNLQPNFQKGGGLDRTSTFRRGCWVRRGDFFQGGCSFHIKNKLKSEIFNDKKSLPATILTYIEVTKEIS